MNLGARATAAQRPPIIALTGEHPLPDGELRLLGAQAAVTGAMTRIELGGRRVLVDCGVAQGTEALEWRLDEAALDVDAVLLTHGHYEHVGSLPELLELGYGGPIYGTPATLAITKLVLADALEARGQTPAESERFLRELERRLRPVPLDQSEKLGDSVELTLREAGHILGSASVELCSDRSRVICSGDLGRPGSPLLPDYHTSWRGSRRVDLVLLESTYGDQEHRHDHDELQRELERILLRAVERGGQVLFPSFAIGRTQTLLYHLNTLVESQRIPPVPIALDSPVGVGVTDTYADFSGVFERESLAKLARSDNPLDLRSLYAVRRHVPSQRIATFTGPLVIIAGSGMCTGGHVVAHLRRLLPLEQSTIVFVGYQAEGTPGRAIQRAGARGGRVSLDHEEVRVRADVETLSGLSAHADRRELAHWLDAIPNVHRVALHHGEPNAQRGFAAWYR